ncbi:MULTISPECIES: single-stranded-DNA-specific exonuclease RecJ [unclassified Neisseria]|uniref:single-stranded-DNA-specific exonuclease RecJ n=1 Tax=unclassified Neisseria TaxID=2623750 RepID=UPI002665CA08|nr:MULTISPECIES: single-stranded-DNA-specific exonuclease RecJ [unclassified Neisseria]MDO1509582.1 single-stranded-DNA-specific exonuclease RecJ [Neisseria sp. MVDL19-042950]MDO1515646.1 single-stranded-DNA-specific exonuclease RecJ [Neisseria sp. MVDL18-041461]MDO1564071.1 single-stranded-DNA-specific exonuclease RecJ [Neisseria sp. MVDL20-010259]
MSVKIRTRTINQSVCQTLIQAGTDPLLARLCAARDVASPAELDDKLSALLPYQTLTNCTEAAVRLADAVQRQENILIVADYDADGATACAVGIKGLSAMGASVDFLVPNRFEHGYGLTPELAELAATQKVKLLVTVDNGIASLAGVARAQELGLDVIITDHHLPAETVPDCIIVNPNQCGCNFASKSLAGVGVIFYVLMALRAELRQRGWFRPSENPLSDGINEPNLAELLDLVALGTVADVVPLDHNNRILVSQGLKRMRAGKMRPGIRALFEVARRDWRKAQPFDMGFALGPRINAAGRLDDMSVGIACLLADNEAEAQSLAAQLNDLNIERREIEQSMLQDALNAFPDSLPDGQTTLVAYRDDFHQGVVGIVASRLKDRFYRPAIVFAPADNGEVRGSGRSIPGLHLRDALDLVSKRHPDMILKFGGHAMAAGLSIREEHIAAFQTAFEHTVRELIHADDLAQTYITDGSLPAADITLTQAQNLARQVWGQGFAPPSFTDEFAVIRQQAMGVNHKKVWLRKEGHEFEAMFWRCTEEIPARIRTVYRPVANEWRNQIELQLYIDYWEAA